jgi:hypothetical protein
VPEESLPPVPVFCAREADAIVATTIAIIAIHFAIFPSHLSRPFHRLACATPRFKRRSQAVIWVKFDALAGEAALILRNGMARKRIVASPESRLPTPSCI